MYIAYFYLCVFTNALNYLQDNHVSKDKWDILFYESAKSSLMYELIGKEKTIGGVVSNNLLCTFKNVPRDYSKQLVQKIAAVTLEDLQRVANKYFKSLFDPTQTMTSIVCHPSKLSENESFFKR